MRLNEARNITEGESGRKNEWGKKQKRPNIKYLFKLSGQVVHRFGCDLSCLQVWHDRAMIRLSVRRQPLLGDISDICVLWKNTILFLSGNTDPLQTHLGSELLIQRGDYRRVILDVTGASCSQTSAIFIVCLLVPLQQGALLQNLKKK